MAKPAELLTGWTSGIVISVIGMMGLAALTIVAERDHVGATNKELLAYVLAFPIYMLSYVPISFQAVFAKSNGSRSSIRAEALPAAV